MNTQKFIIKFFPEIMIKGASRKRQMIGQLYNNIYRLSKNISEETSLKKFLDKIEIECQKKVVTETRLMLLQTPGVELVLEALQFDDMSNLDLITEKVNEQTAHEIQGKTFVIRSKRVGKHDFKSPKLEQAIGGFMLSQNPNSKGVDLHKPEVTIRIELLNDQLNIITSKHKGLGGFPLGTQGSILSLMSGGFDSTVASYLTMKRGLKTHYIFFNLGGLAHEIGVKQVAYFLWSKF
jgi:thiamine biosynthesis protein ThiI